MKLRRKRVFFLASLSFIFFSCVTMADYDYTAIHKNLAVGNYKSVLAELDENRESIYTEKDNVLYSLDKGILYHFDGRYEESNKLFANAEALMDEYSAKSISQMLASAVTNDTVQDYAGEDFENIYTNIFMALNYIFLGDMDDAMVEVRRFDNKIRLLRDKYNKTVEEFSKTSEDVKIKEVAVQFSDSALARYISMLMYRTEKNLDSARIDRNYIQQAFTTQPGLYDFAIPSTIEEELSVPKGNARLNVIAFSGKAPVKREEVIRIYWSQDIWFKLALPVMEKRNSYSDTITVTAVNMVTGERNTRRLEKIESLENIALDTFNRNYSVTYAKSLSRALARAVTTSTLNRVSDEALNNNDSSMYMIFSILDFASKIGTEFVERADVRTSHFFPAEASVTGITLSPGTYEITVTYSHGSRTLYTEKKITEVRADSLNLVETSCSL